MNIYFPRAFMIALNIAGMIANFLNIGFNGFGFVPAFLIIVNIFCLSYYFKQIINEHDEKINSTQKKSSPSDDLKNIENEIIEDKKNKDCIVVDL